MEEKREERKNEKVKVEKVKRTAHSKLITFYLVLFDMFALNIAYFVALWLRFDLRISAIPKGYLKTFLTFAPIYTICAMLVFGALNLYDSLWRYASFPELNRIMLSTVITTIMQVAGTVIFLERMPVSYYLMGAITQTTLILAVRFGYRYISFERNRHVKEALAQKENMPKAMIIGAGAAGRVLIRELIGSDKAEAIPVCVIDDDSRKWGRSLEGVQIIGGREDIMAAVEKYDIKQIMFAIPTASKKERRDILNLCKETGCQLKTLPGVYQLANGELTLSKMKEVTVEDLLGRDTIKADMDEIYKHIKGETILVTGGGGSIGSELCRQIASHEPKQLIIFDIYENNAYAIEQELKRKYPELNLVTLIGSVRDSRRIEWVFETYKPDMVYHAAAHKHVPLMETSPNEAIKNNVIGTYKTAYAALKNNTKRFVLISTDKAVNPTNIMGASKRLCEMVIQCMDAVSKSGRMDLLPMVHAHIDELDDGNVTMESFDREKLEQIHNISMRSVKNTDRKGTQFVAVRFGNVLGSNGSVIPLFKKQIAEGGPVTVTHPDIIRYFMTIPEAVSLVLQAGTYAWGGEIFVLDMGEPVKIDTLARNLIKLSGFKPDKDIKIEYTGLRPGEKLFEEKLMAEEGIKKTDNELIHIGKPIPFDTEEFLGKLEELAKASYNNSDNIVEMVEGMVSTFHPVGAKPTGKENMGEAEHMNMATAKVALE